MKLNRYRNHNYCNSTWTRCSRAYDRTAPVQGPGYWLWTSRVPGSENKVRESTGCSKKINCNQKLNLKETKMGWYSIRTMHAVFFRYQTFCDKTKIFGTPRVCRPNCVCALRIIGTLPNNNKTYLIKLFKQTLIKSIFNKSFENFDMKKFALRKKMLFMQYFR